MVKVKDSESLRALVKMVESHGEECSVTHKTAAAAIVDSLRTGFPDLNNENVAHIALAVSQIMATMARMPPRPLAETIDNMFTGYALAAANLVGIYEIGDDVPRNFPDGKDVVNGDEKPAEGEWDIKRLYL
jgi:hypothetical protein